MTPRSEDRTLGELARLFDDLRQDMGQRFDDLRGRLDQIDNLYLRKDVYEANRATYMEANTERDRKIAALESTQSWLARVIIGAVVLAVIGGLFAASGGIK